MLKRVLGVSVLGVGVFALQGDVEAHLAGTVYKPTYKHVSSYDCIGTFAQVPNLDAHPALFECEAVVSAFDVLCANPEGKITRGNSGPRTVTQVAEDMFTNADITDKRRGKAQKTLRLPDDVLTAGDQVCKDRNRNWSAVDEMVLSVDVRLKTFDCNNEDCSNRAQAFEALLTCTVPPGFDIVANPLPGTPENPIGTDYDCTLLEEAHCDRGDACPIP